MKLNKFIEQLQKLNPEIEVILSKDSEGNYFSPYSDYSLQHYEPESTWSGEIHACGEGKETAIVLWPVN